MYLPRHFEETRPSILSDFIRQHPLGSTIIAVGNSLSADPIPWLHRPGPGPLGTLAAHVARSNPLAALAREGIACLVLFHGPQHYISPGWYASKATDGRVVPTWNYQVVQARGTLQAVQDPAWIETLLEELTREHERSQPAPWSASDAPADFRQRLAQAIVGLELRVDSLVGKFKLSQNQPEANRESLLLALRDLGTPEALAMARAIESNRPTGT